MTKVPEFGSVFVEQQIWDSGPQEVLMRLSQVWICADIDEVNAIRAMRSEMIEYMFFALGDVLAVESVLDYRYYVYRQCWTRELNSFHCALGGRRRSCFSYSGDREVFSHSIIYNNIPLIIWVNVDRFFR